MGMMLLLGAAAVGVYGYMQGWFDTLIPAAVLPKSNPTGTTNPITNPKTQIVNAPSTPPAVGVVVNSGNDVAAQAAAKVPYILPSNAIVSQAPSGYALVKVKDTGGVNSGFIYLRNDIAQKDIDSANAIVAQVNQAAKELWDVQYAMNPQTAGPMPTPVPPVDRDTLSLPDLKAGVSGLGYYRSRDWRM